MILDSDGSEFDWTVGYNPPPEKFEATLQKSLDGKDTFRALAAAYAKNPKDEAVVFALANKLGERYDADNQAKAIEKYKEVVALDPNGHGGKYADEEEGYTVPYTVYAEYALARMNTSGRKPDMEPVRAFVKKYSESPLVKSAYRQMAYYYSQMAAKEEADTFFAEYTAKYPNDARAADMWLARILKDKGPLEQGAALVDRINDLTHNYPIPDMQKDMAGYFILKGDKAKADEAYGKKFMDDKVKAFAYDLMHYASFWLDQKTNEDSAMAMAELAYKLQPENPFVLQDLATFYLNTKHEDKALAVFGPDYLHGAARDATVLNLYARFWSSQAMNLESALEAAKKAVDLKPVTSEYWSTLSDVYLKMKNYPEALKAAEKAVELTESDYQAPLKQKIDAIKKAQAEGTK